MHYLAICCVAKDEDPFLKEWLSYHAQRGVEHFYIYDNMSQTPIREVLGGFADGKQVTIRRVPGRGVQLAVYQDCLGSFGKDCRWIGFVDLDEFVFPVEDDDLRVLLCEYEVHAGLAATWRLFNSSGHLKRPAGPVLQHYTEAFAAQTSFHTKCFVDPARTLAPLSAHHFHMAEGEYCVNEDHYPVSPWRQFTFSEGRRIRINHYFVRSQQDFEEKLRRGRVSIADPERAYDMTMFLSALAKPYVQDTAIQRFLPALEEALARNVLPTPTPLLPGDMPYDDMMAAALGYMDAGKPEKCLACLCSPSPAHRKKADFWTLRAMAAFVAGNIDRADVFLREALRRECTETAYNQLQHILRARGRTALASAVAAKLREAPELFG